jgi:hypothetical protein
MSYPTYDLTFRQLQEQHAEWAERHFGSEGDPRYHQRGAAVGVAEELGEFAAVAESDQHVVELTRALGRLAHATLKRHQGIRTAEDHEARAKDAVADMIIFATDYATRCGWDLQSIMEGVWSEVQQRDWRCEHGGPVATCQVCTGGTGANL